MKHGAIPSLVMAMWFILAACPASAQAVSDMTDPSQEKIARKIARLGGGPRGSATTYAATALAVLFTRQVAILETASEATDGPRANLRLLQTGGLELGIVHAGDMPSILDEDASLALAVTGLYGVPAQLVVPAGSRITRVSDLTDKRVCVGSHGSSSALAAERLFSRLGLWHSMTRLYLGHGEAVEALRQGRAEAMFHLDGLAGKPLATWACQEGLRLLDLHQEAQASGFYAAHPCYRAATIPAGTYAGQEHPVATFADTAWLCASALVSAEAVRDCLTALSSTDGLEHLSAVIKGVNMVRPAEWPTPALPLHPGVTLGMTLAGGQAAQVSTANRK